MASRRTTLCHLRRRAQLRATPPGRNACHRTSSWPTNASDPANETVPRQRTFLSVIQSSSSAIICHSTFLDSPSAERRVRRDAACRPNGDAARGFCLSNLHWHKRLPRDGRTGQIGHKSRDALPSKIPHRRSRARVEQSGLTRDRNHHVELRRQALCTKSQEIEQAT